MALPDLGTSLAYLGLIAEINLPEQGFPARFLDARVTALEQKLQNLATKDDLAGCGRKVRRSAAVYGASTVSAAFGM